MATISPLVQARNIANRSNTTYGLLSNESTAVIQRENMAPIGKVLVVGRKGVFNLNMLYDWWMLYAIKKNMIKDGKWIIPNETLDALLADEYIKFGARAGVPFHIQTYLRMLGHHLGYDYQLNLAPNQLGYLGNQERILRDTRKHHRISQK